MQKITLVAILAAVLALPSLLVMQPLAHAAGATGPHSVVMVCSSIGSAGTNILTLYVQGISSDDPNALSAVGSPTQPPPGVECGVALANVLSLCNGASSGKKGGCAGGGVIAQPLYTINSVIPYEGSWIYTLTSP